DVSRTRAWSSASNDRLTADVRFCPKQTWTTALHMSAFGVKADMTFSGSLLSRSLLGVNRTWAGAVHMSAFDPKRTWTSHRTCPLLNVNVRVRMGMTSTAF